jgi:hypothetical protein
MEVALHIPASWSLGRPSLIGREGRRRQRTNLQSRERCDGVGDGDGDTVGGVEAKSGVGDGVGDGNDSRGTKGGGVDGAASREAAA